MYTYKFPRPALTVDAIVYTKENNSVFVLFVKRGEEPFEGKWALPGGFVHIDERLENSCIRELHEETGLKVDNMVQYKTYDAIDRDPRGRTISVVHFTEIAGKEKVKGSDDAAQASWFPVTDLPDLAFDHTQIVGEFFKTIL